MMIVDSTDIRQLEQLSDTLTDIIDVLKHNLIINDFNTLGELDFLSFQKRAEEIKKKLDLIVSSTSMNLG